MNGVGCCTCTRIMGVERNTIFRYSKLRLQSVTLRILPGSDVIICAEMNQQSCYVWANRINAGCFMCIAGSAGRL